MVIFYSYVTVYQRVYKSLMFGCFLSPDGGFRHAQVAKLFEDFKVTKAQMATEMS